MTLDELQTLVKQAEEKLRDYAEDDDDDAWDIVKALDGVDWEEFYDQEDMDDTVKDVVDEGIPVDTMRALMRSGALSHNEAAALTYRGLCELVEDRLA